jgi:hypothetical protein
MPGSSRTVASSSAHRLIAGDRVAGTSVYDPRGIKLGTVEDVMIDKTTGRIAYAILSFGGFLGIGGRHHPLPWDALRYDPALSGYVVNLTREQLEKAPTYGDKTPPPWEDEAWGRRVHDYYGAEPYWRDRT